MATLRISSQSQLAKDPVDFQNSCTAWQLSQGGLILPFTVKTRLQDSKWKMIEDQHLCIATLTATSRALASARYADWAFSSLCQPRSLWHLQESNSSNARLLFGPRRISENANHPSFISPSYYSSVTLQPWSKKWTKETKGDSWLRLMCKTPPDIGDTSSSSRRMGWKRSKPKSSIAYDGPRSHGFHEVPRPSFRLSSVELRHPKSTHPRWRCRGAYQINRNLSIVTALHMLDPYL